MSGRNIADELDRGTYVAHRSFRNGNDCDNRAMRRCPRCGGVQYDWGLSGWSGNKRFPYTLHWYCNGRGACGFSSSERMSEKRLRELRQRPPKLSRASSAPWKRWREMQSRGSSA